MKQKRYTEEQIIYALRQVEAGVTVSEICRTMGYASIRSMLGRRME